MDPSEQYLDLVAERITRLRRTQGGAIAHAARLCADAIGNGRIAWVFGAGHSAMPALEAYPRMGGVFGFVPMIELSLLYFTNVIGSGGLDQAIFLERVPGFADAILRSHEPRAGDVLLIYSSSGLEAVPRELAQGARARGVQVVAVTSLDYSREAGRRRGVGEFLTDDADLVIDNGVPPGDAILDLPGTDSRVGPTSTIINCSIMNCIAVNTAALLRERGAEPLVFTSPHFEVEGIRSYQQALTRFRRLTGRYDATDGITDA